MLNEPITKAVSFVCILLNCIVRSWCPSQYVPYQRTCKLWLGSPHTARTIATFAEFAFYRQASITLGIKYLWYTKENGIGLLLWLWIFGESLSWTGLVAQNAVANAMEDVVWSVWFAVALFCSKRLVRYIMVPVIMVYIVWHLPHALSSLFAYPTAHATHAPSKLTTNTLVSQLDDSGRWVVPSVVAKLAFYVVLVVVEERTKAK